MPGALFASKDEETSKYVRAPVECCQINTTSYLRSSLLTLSAPNELLKQCKVAMRPKDYDYPNTMCSAMSKTKIMAPNLRPISGIPHISSVCPSETI